MSDATPESTPPILTIEGARATIRLNRPKQLNRLGQDDLETLMSLFATIEADPTVRVLVLTGSGRAFSAGFDLNSIATRSDSGDDGRSAGVSFEAVANRLEYLQMPTICRLNGGVYGGSTDMALACDFRIGVASCEMFMPAARLGLHYYRGGIERYVARLGADHAKRLFLTAQKIDSAEMLRIGYLTAVASADMLDAEVDTLATILAGNAPKAMRGMKFAINEFSRNRIDGDAIEARYRDSLRGDEIKEGVAAFAEKRPPRFADS